MPMQFLKRLTLPSLRVYAISSIAMFLCSVFYAAQVVRDTSWKANHTDVEVKNIPEDIVEIKTEKEGMYIRDIMVYMGDDPICFWALTNMMHCGFIYFGRLIQELIFGELRASERQHLKDKFWNFVFYKFVFVFGILNVQYMHEMAMWWAWLTVLGFLSLLSQLCKDRFEYLSFSATTPGWRHAQLFALLGVILALSLCMLLVCTAAAFFLISFHTFAFAAAECILLAIRALQLLLRHSLPLISTFSSIPSLSSASSVKFSYYTDLVADLLALSVDLLHHLHMLCWSNVFLSMASLVMFMQMRYLFYEIDRRLTRHKNWLALMTHIEQNYPMATQENLEAHSDNCVICWEKMETARKLPCGHLFHSVCLQSWLEQDTSCPTCRRALTMQTRSAAEPQPDAQVRRNENHFFHFDGSRYVSWLPSFSVEVSNVRLRNASAQSDSQSNSQSEAPVELQSNLQDDTQTESQSNLCPVVSQAKQLSPHYPRITILENLREMSPVKWTDEDFFCQLAVQCRMLEISQLCPNEKIDPLSQSLRRRIQFPIDKMEFSSFSKSFAELERMLQCGTERMLCVARSNYVDKQKKQTDEHWNNADTIPRFHWPVESTSDGPRRARRTRKATHLAETKFRQAETEHHPSFRLADGQLVDRSANECDWYSHVTISDRGSLIGNESPPSRDQTLSWVPIVRQTGHRRISEPFASAPKSTCLRSNPAPILTGREISEKPCVRCARISPGISSPRCASLSSMRRTRVSSIAWHTD